MNKSDLFRAFDGVDDDILARSEAPAARRRPPAARKWMALAACLALAASLVGAAYAAEAREYGAAVAFFEENGLSTQGLSRAEVKAVYRDITTRSFANGKTAQVLERNLPGLEIDQREPTPEELAAAWDRNVWRSAQPGAGISYRCCAEEAAGGRSFSYLERYEDGTLIWAAKFADGIGGYASASGGAAVWGETYSWSGVQPSCAWLAMVDETGKVLWKTRLDHRFQNECIAAVVDNGDGTWAVVSRGDLKYLCLSQYDADGNELSFHKTEVGNYGIWNVVRLGGGYLVQLGNIADGETARLAKLDREGNVLDSFTYEGEDCDYYIKDMAEFGGRVYLSAYAVPKQTDEGGRYEIADILACLFDNNIWEISSEELTPMVRDNYTAVLLLCGPEGGAPETFYSVEGSLGGKLAVSGAGELAWDVESIANTFFSPATSAFTIGGECQVFRYTFDAAGALLGQTDTGETVPYRR